MVIKHRYGYYGPVKIFDRLVAENWYGETIAESEDKAKSNLAYQYKKSHNLSARSKVILPDKVYLAS